MNLASCNTGSELATAPLHVGGLGGQLVHEIIHSVARVALHPRKRDFAGTIERQSKEVFPQVPIRDGLSLGVLPATTEPAHVPFLLKALHDVIGIRDNFQGVIGVVAQRLNYR